MSEAPLLASSPCPGLSVPFSVPSWAARLPKRRLGDGISTLISPLTRRIFYINIPVVVIVVFGIYFFLKLRVDNSSIREKLKRIDYIGIVVFVGSTTSFLFGLTAGGVLFPWSSGNVLAPLIIGIFGWVGFWAYEDYVAKEPMMPMRIFKERTAFAGYLGTWVHGIILWSLIYYLLLWVHLPYQIMI
jgi:Fungal trichothecene efflux pump (TRI12)